MSRLTVLASKAMYDFGSKFYEPVAEITETGWGSLGVETWAREHEVKQIKLDCRTWVKMAYYYGAFGEIDTNGWFTDKQLCEEAAAVMGEELVRKEIAEAQHKADKALQLKQQLKNIYTLNNS